MVLFIAAKFLFSDGNWRDRLILLRIYNKRRTQNMFLNTCMILTFCSSTVNAEDKPNAWRFLYPTCSFTTTEVLKIRFTLLKYSSKELATVWEVTMFSYLICYYLYFRFCCFCDCLLANSLITCTLRVPT